MSEVLPNLPGAWPPSKKHRVHLGLPASKVPAEIAGFEILEELGHGGMGIVFKARQKTISRIVALKLLPPSIAQNRQFIERFFREARATARFNHPNLVAGIDVGQDPSTGLFFFAMEFVDGPSLGQVLAQEGALPEPRAWRSLAT